MKIKKFYVNARFLTQKVTGVQRFAIEISLRLKKIYGDRIVFLSPSAILNKDIASELDASVIGSGLGHFWEQIELPIFLRRNGSPLLVNMCNTAPLFYDRSLVSIYDLTFYHHKEWFSLPFHTYYNFLIPKIIRRSLHVITDSMYVRDDIHDVYGTDKNKISVAYGSYATVFKPIELEREPFALAVGSIDPRKNLPAIIDIFKDIKNFNLVIVGSANKVFAESELKSVPDNIKFTGYLSDAELVELYNKAMFFVYPSFSEGFGIPPLEAQACGCPVVASGTTSLPEVGADSFLYCDPYDKEDIKNKCLEMINNPELRQNLAFKGFKNVRRFSWDSSAEKISAIINQYIYEKDRI